MPTLPRTDRSAMAGFDKSVPALEDGQRLARDEFERRYLAMPPEFKAELIEGVVYVASPVSDWHSAPHAAMSTWLGHYWPFTPGIAMRIDGTVRLDDVNEPQPDLFLRIREDHGGQAAVANGQGFGPLSRGMGVPENMGPVGGGEGRGDGKQKAEGFHR